LDRGGLVYAWNHGVSQISSYSWGGILLPCPFNVLILGVILIRAVSHY
jgi:hypothetical protein